MTHRYKIGELVFVKHAHNRDVPGGAYIVIKRLPEYRGEFEYRVGIAVSCRSALCAKLN